MTASSPLLIIVGGGLSGCLAALAVAERRPDVRLLLLEQGQSFGGNHIWSFFDSDVDPADAWLVEPLVSSRWNSHEVNFPRRKRTLQFGYNSVRSDRLDAVVRQKLRPDQYRLNVRIDQVAPGEVRLASGETLDAEAVVDARGGALPDGLDLAWQKFVGRVIRTTVPHGAEAPVIMDASVAQLDGYRFIYLLPFTPTELLIEDTYYSLSPSLDVPLLRERIDRYADEHGWGEAETLHEETGVLPVALGGSAECLWPEEEHIARLGLHGGFFHPTTGYSFPDAVRNAVLLSNAPAMWSSALHEHFRDRALDLWEGRSFYRLLNRMLFRAAAPEQRYRVLEHFYRLPAGIISRFYAGQSTFFDKARILSGKPPVPLLSALKAMREEAA